MPLTRGIFFLWQFVRGYSEGRMKIIFRHHSAVVTIERLAGSRNGVIEVRNTGTFTQAAFDHLRPRVVEATKNAPAMVVRLDTAADIVVTPPMIDSWVYLLDLPDQAVVCTDWQYPLWLRHALRLRALGVRRSVFSVEQLAVALEWAELAAASRLRRMGQVLDGLQASGPAPLE